MYYFTELTRSRFLFFQNAPQLLEAATMALVSFSILFSFLSLRISRLGQHRLQTQNRNLRVQRCYFEFEGI